MGVAGCVEICCNRKENELNSHFLISPNINNKNILNSNDYNDYSRKFETKLTEYGKYLDTKTFNDIIPENANKYIVENSFIIPENIRINNNIYEMEPVEFENGNIYKGNWNENYKMDGLGKYFIKEGNIFIEGIWDDGILIYGRIFYPNNNIYEGEIKDSNYHGKGKLIFNNGETYEGDFIGGEITGKGIFIFSDGTAYEGEFQKGEFKGHGIMKWTNGVQYEGIFSGAILKDYGKLSGDHGDRYEGYFYNNYFHGKGIYIYSDGSSYEGDFEFGLKNGKGIYKKKDEYIYDGEWRNNFPNGSGKYYYKNFIICGIWRNGINIEISGYEKGTENSFDKNILNFEPESFSLIPNKLPNLEQIEGETNFRVETTPSYLNSQNE
jgi:hypothetical protein